MKIETKFNVKDAVYFVYKDGVRSGKIKEIHIIASGNSSDVEIEYIIKMTGLDIPRKEDKIFDSKESLIKSL